MALFRSDDPAPRTPAHPAETHTIIGAGAALDGALRALGNLNVGGTVVGDVEVDGRAVVMPGGVIDGAMSATEAEVAGHVTGTLTVGERLVLRATAVVDGDVRAGTFVIEEGAMFNGRCAMGNGEAVGDGSVGGVAVGGDGAIPAGQQP